jgi:hypothetical protein
LNVSIGGLLPCSVKAQSKYRAVHLDAGEYTVEQLRYSGEVAALNSAPMSAAL